MKFLSLIIHPHVFPNP